MVIVGVDRYAGDKSFIQQIKFPQATDFSVSDENNLSVGNGGIDSGNKQVRDVVAVFASGWSYVTKFEVGDEES